MLGRWLRGGSIPSCSRGSVNRNPDYMKTQQDKIDRGIEDSETEDYRRTRAFDGLLDCAEKGGLDNMSVVVDAETEE